MPLHTSQGVQLSGPLTCRPLMTSATAGGYTQSLLHHLWWLSSILCPHLVNLLPNCHWMCLMLLSWWLVTDWTLYPLLIPRYLLLCGPLLMYATICFTMVLCNYDMLLCICWFDLKTVCREVDLSSLEQTTEYTKSLHVSIKHQSLQSWTQVSTTNVWCKL